MEVGEHNDKNASELTEEQKQTVRALASLASGLVGCLVGGDTASAVSGMQTRKVTVENNSFAGDYIREEHKGSVEYWKDQVRENVGENTISQITNGVLTAYGNTVDLGVGVADTVLDAVLAFSSCTMGASYCDTAMKDLQGANQTAYDAMWALSSGQAWDSFVNTFSKAQKGDQKALEEVAGILSSVLAPSKIVAGNTGKTGSLGNKVEHVVSDASNTHKIENAVTDAGKINANPKTPLSYVDEPPFNPSGTGGAAKPWSTKGRINHIELPTEGKIRYVPPEDYVPSNPLPRGPNNGYYDKFGNEWIKGPSRTPGQAFKWDVQLSNKGRAQLGWASGDVSHLNISLDGRITHR